MRAILNVLSKEEKNKIDSTSIEILESVGVKIDHKGIFKLLHDAGAQVEKDKGIVKFPEKLVRQYLSYCPSSVKFSG